jgi:hypothetical protein
MVMQVQAFWDVALSNYQCFKGSQYLRLQGQVIQFTIAMFQRTAASTFRVKEEKSRFLSHVATIYQTAWHHIPQNHHPNVHHHKSHKFHTIIRTYLISAYI